ncbi:MAG: c-type cytochrome [Hyphomonadaceae bacterium]|jgi:cytochrome c553|nr:c-type cytochrome [Hyphomonadaceae bacterium]
MPDSSPLRRSRTFSFAIAAALCASAATQLRAADPFEERLQLCGACHGETGNSRMENTPSLAGQPALFLTNQLILMRERLRKSEVMAPFVKGLKDEEIIALSEHYAKATSEPSDEPVDPAVLSRGRELAQQLYCASCHLPGYEGREQMPRLAHQRIDYLMQSMQAYRDGTRSGIDTSMNGVMVGVSDPDIRALAHYLASRR